MGELGYTTRSNTPSLQGKKYVYFCCHPDDFQIYFKSIRKEIFQYQNCAIWFNEKPEENWDEEEINAKLGKMSLFVIPVTSQFLHEENIGHDVELPFAMKHHIPILPLIQEKGLENELDLHCLDNTGLSEDFTEIPAEGELEKFLSSVLIGDDLTEKVRKAFNTYIFMSYRKKDRKYAQELMHMIHSNDFCRDIAIWYDEYLNPGEHFNDEIEDAMKKSSMFTFVITPNIYGPSDDDTTSDQSKPHDNYVVEKEYPLAKETKRPILPVEMVPTNRDQLNKKFDGMPKPVNVYDSHALSKALQEKLQEVTNFKNNDEPEHMFFIGLAYLYGIDVEVDSDRAVQLITNAAEANLPEAMKKLSQMYKFGEGVDLNLEESVWWLEQIKELFKKEFNESDSEEDAYRYSEALGDLGDAWQELGLLDKSNEAYIEMLSLAEYSAQKYGGSLNQQIMIYCYLALGRNSMAEGDLNKAKERCQQGLEIGRQLSLEDETIETKKSLASIYCHLSVINADIEHFSEAKDWGLQALELCKSISSETGTEESRRNEIGIYRNLGCFCLKEGNLSEARKWSQQALKLNEEFIKDAELIVSYLDQMKIYEDLIEISWEEGKLDEAKKWALECEDLYEYMGQENEIVEARNHMIPIYNWLGRISRVEEDLDDAKVQCMKGLEVSEALWRETGNADALTDIADFCNNLGALNMDDGIMTEAQEWYQKALKADEKFEELSRNKESIDILTDRVKLYNNLAEIDRSKNEYGEAKQWCEKGLNAIEEFNQKSSIADARECLISVYNELGKIYQDEGDINETKKWFKKGAEVSEKLSHDTGMLGPSKDMCSFYDKLSVISLDEGNLAEAYKWFKKKLEISENIWLDTKDDEDCLVLAASYNNVADVDLKEGNLDKAKLEAIKGVDLGEKLIRESKTVDPRECLITLYDKMGQINRVEGNFTQAKEWYLKKLNLSEEIDQGIEGLEGIEEVEMRLNLALCYNTLGLISREEGINLRESQQYFRKAMMISDELSEDLSGDPGSEEVDYYRALIYENLGEIDCELDDMDEAKLCYGNSVLTWEFLCQEIGHIDMYAKLAQAYYRLGSFDDNHCNISLLKKALDICQQLIKNCPDERDYKEFLGIVKEKLKEQQRD